MHGSLSTSETIDVKNVFTFFYSCHVFTFLTFFPYVFKIKNVGNLLSIQASSEI